MKQTGEKILCDLCKRYCIKFYIDGRLRYEGWAIMCEACHKLNGGKLGLGIGQKYMWIKEQGWMKVEG